jgi:hypothetical protein
MPSEIHRVMKNPDDLDDLVASGAIHDEMTPTPALACNVKAAESRKNVIAGCAGGHLGAGMKSRQGVN